MSRPIDYARFNCIGDSLESEMDSDHGSDDDKFVGSARSEEGLLKAFIAIREKRQEIDRLFDENLGRDDGSTELRSAVRHYDDVVARLLTLDGVKEEHDVQAVSHRIEVVAARLGGAKALKRCGDLESAETKATLALDALAANIDGSMTVSRKELKVKHSRQGWGMLQARLAESYLLRAEIRFQLGKFHEARGDALQAFSWSRERNATDGTEDVAQKLAIRCEMALHAGGPGPDGQGEMLSPEETSSLELIEGGSQPMRSTNVVAGSKLLPSEERNIQEPKPCGESIVKNGCVNRMNLDDMD